MNEFTLLSIELTDSKRVEKRDTFLRGKIGKRRSIIRKSSFLLARKVVSFNLCPDIK